MCPTLRRPTLRRARILAVEIRPALVALSRFSRRLAWWFVATALTLALTLGSAHAAEPGAVSGTATNQSGVRTRLSPPYAAAVECGPERVFLTLTATPATSQAVSWRALPTTNTLQAEILPAPAGPIPSRAATAVTALVERVVYEGDAVRLHAAVEFTDLRPDKVYAYRVGDGVTWSEWNLFRTAAAEPAPFRFVYLGDLQNHILAQGARVVRAAMSRAPDARFVVHAGDLVTDPLRDELWHEWYAAGGWAYRHTPSLLTPGNHDLQQGGADKIWRPQFALPRNGPPGLEELAYWVDYQGARLVSFNGNAYSDPNQLAWLESVLAVTHPTWKILVTHQPLYATAKGRDSAKRRELLQPILDRHGVDLVLAGHDHVYGRTPKIRTGQKVGETDSGVIYVTSVAGAKMYEVNPASEPWMAQLRGHVQTFQIISVSPRALRYEAFTADGRLLDAFDLHRQDSGRTVLVDRRPPPAETVVGN